MITREEAKEKLLGECKIIMHYTWSEDRQKVDVPHWYLSDIKTIKLINEIYDSFESKLSNNPLQLTCDGCEHWVKGNGDFGDCSMNVSNIPRCEGITTHDFYCKHHDKKDTK